VAGADWFTAVTATTETGRLAASVDWSATPLGEPATWPTALRVAVETCFSTRFPMLVVWGPELTKIYNDGYRSMLGSEKHPAAMGAPAREVWPEIWDVIGPLFEVVLETGQPTFVEDQLLLMERSGFVEETYFTYSYSPIRNDDGSVGGVLDTCTETTEQVLNARRLSVLSELRGALVTATTVREACTEALAVLRRDESDVCAAAVHLLQADGSFATSPDPLAEEAVVRLVLAQGALEQVDDVVLVPMAEAGVLAVRLNPRRPWDEGYRSFVGLAASTVEGAVVELRRRRVELDDLRRTSEVLQRAMLPDEPADPALACRYLPAAAGMRVGGDWFDVVDLGHDRVALVVGDCVGHGLQAAATMGQLRSACRALLLEERGPGQALRSLDRFAGGIDGAESSTVFCAVVDRRTGRVQYAAAGHPPPLVIGPEGVRWLADGRGVPLAVVPDPALEQGDAQLAPGETLVLYTDGLVERRGESLDAGFDRLAGFAAGLAGASPAEVADDLVIGLLAEGGDDDVALVAYRQVSPAGWPAGGAPPAGTPR
jgi:hypothetical protein